MQNILKLFNLNLSKKNPTVMDEEQQLIHDIVSKLCQSSDSTIIANDVNGIGTQYHIHNESNGYFVVLTGNCIKVTNNELYIVRYFELDMIKHLVELVISRIKDDANRIHNAVLMSELQVLQSMKDSL